MKVNPLGRRRRQECLPIFQGRTKSCKSTFTARKKGTTHDWGWEREEGGGKGERNCAYRSEIKGGIREKLARSAAEKDADQKKGRNYTVSRRVERGWDNGGGETLSSTAGKGYLLGRGKPVFFTPKDIAEFPVVRKETPREGAEGLAVWDDWGV